MTAADEAAVQAVIEAWGWEMAAKAGRRERLARAAVAAARPHIAAQIADAIEADIDPNGAIQKIHYFRLAAAIARQTGGRDV